MTTLILRPDLGKKAYRLKCRFRIGAWPKPAFLGKAKVKAAEAFVADMRKQGWEYVGDYGVSMTGPYPSVDPITVHVVRQPTARQMIEGIRKGERYRPAGGTVAPTVLPLGEHEHWEYELRAVFVHNVIMTEVEK